MPKPKPKTQASSAQARSIRALESSDEEEPQQPLVNNDVVLIAIDRAVNACTILFSHSKKTKLEGL
jgi:non-canonical (house-cleaning) NTP pyrophosphatase